MTTPTRDKLTITRDEALDMLNGDHPDYETVHDEISGKRRWSVDHWLVVKRKSDGRFFADGYSVGATESQDERPWEYDEPNFTEVFAKQITTTVYE